MMPARRLELQQGRFSDAIVIFSPFQGLLVGVEGMRAATTSVKPCVCGWLKRFQPLKPAAYDLK